MSRKAPFAESFRAEVARLARKEVKSQVEPLTKGLVEARKTIATQRREMAGLKRELQTLRKAIASQVGPSAAEDASHSEAALLGKWRKDSVRSTRRRLGLTQGELATLLGVSLGSVSGWETGRVEPRTAWKQAVLELRQLNAGEIAARLDRDS